MKEVHPNINRYTAQDVLQSFEASIPSKLSLPPTHQLTISHLMWNCPKLMVARRRQDITKETKGLINNSSIFGC
jgi:hypothetical protein